jgi:hypothetical protein
MLASGLAEAQGTYGTKVKAGDPDVGLPLSAFGPVGGFISFPPVTTQNFAFLSYWDVGATPGLFDNEDVIYLQFGSSISPPSRIVRANNIRMTGWGNYAAGSYVKQGDSDIGQQLLPWIAAPPFPAVGSTGFYFEDQLNNGYTLDDPIYLRAGAPPGLQLGGNDIRITPVLSFPAGSRVSNSDPDAGSPMSRFYLGNPPAAGPLTFPPSGPAPTGVAPIAPETAILSFFNANGNTLGPNAVYDEGDAVYFDINPVGVVSPNDVRLY